MNHLAKKIDALARPLIPCYSHFDVGNRLLFTGHSHQAWPDVALDGLREAFTSAATHVDKKWEPAYGKVEKLRHYLRHYYDDENGKYTLGQNTHQLLVAWLSSLPLRQKHKIITTTHEFYSMERQLRRLEEEGLTVCRLEPEPFDSLADRLAEAMDDDTAAVMLSRVFFDSALINTAVTDIAEAARNRHIPFLIDDYHGTNVVPLSLKEANLQDCYLLIGGYKYLQWGEGNCFLRYPANCNLRPAVTGWFASFSTLSDKKPSEKVRYADENQRFAGGTFDSTSQFRAAKVVDFFQEHQLTPPILQKQYQRQIRYLKYCFEQLSADKKQISLKHTYPLDQNGGFLAFTSRRAVELQELLFQHGVLSDARGTVLRFGPAPYTTSAHIEQATTQLAKCLKKLRV